MKRLLFVLAIVVAGLSLASASTSNDAVAGPGPEQWPPLTGSNCYDVSGDGEVDLANDILGVITRYNTSWPNETYALLYDVSGGNYIDLANDILGVITHYQAPTCDLADIQVVQATLAIMKYKDPAVAIADGYIQSTQDVPNMGIHMYNLEYQVAYPDFASQMVHPAGLVYTDADPANGSDTPAELIGAWYTIPMPEVCQRFGIPNPGSCPTAQPAGFAGDGDLTMDTQALQQAWHTHTGLCWGKTGTPQAWVIETFSTNTQSQCEGGDYGPCPCFWFATYGWMMHLYNFIPNPFDQYPAGYPTEGRFTRWNENVPYTDAGG